MFKLNHCQSFGKGWFLQTNFTQAHFVCTGSKLGSCNIVQDVWSFSYLTMQIFNVCYNIAPLHHCPG